jgi:hypothetical protein
VLKDVKKRWPDPDFSTRQMVYRRRPALSTFFYEANQGIGVDR